MKNRIASAAILAAFAFTGTAAAQSVTILGGGVKGQPYQFAVAQSKILKEHGNISATPQSSQGIPAQARLVARGEANFAWGLGGPVGAWAYKGTNTFAKEEPKTELRAVLSYPFGSLQWVTLADSGINNVKDFKGKRVSVGSASSTTQTFSRFLLPAHGLGDGSFDEQTPGFTGGFDALRDGTVDAHLTMGLPPMSIIQEAAAVKKIRLVDMDPAAINEVVKNYGPGIVATKIDAGVYGANQANTGATNSLSMFFGFSTSTNTSPDVVYAVTKNLFDNLKDFHAASASAASVTLAGACTGLAFPLHEGAKRYYKEVGKTDC